jgi:hypothetical protein
MPIAQAIELQISGVGDIGRGVIGGEGVRGVFCPLPASPPTDPLSPREARFFAKRGPAAMPISPGV